MSSYSKASKKDEQDLKAYQEKKAAQPEAVQGQVDTKALQKDLEGKGIALSTFSNADEAYRKRTLKEDYAAMKLKYGWLYDQPIKADGNV